MLNHMEPSELLEEVAKALGWTNVFTDADGCTSGRPAGSTKKQPVRRVPAYTSEIGLAHLACQTLMNTGTRCMLWHAYLYMAVSQGGTHCHGSVVLHATPSQYCHAALEVMNYHKKLCREQAAVGKVVVGLA